MPSVNYHWDPIEDNVIAEFDDDGNLLVEYTTEPELHGDVISQRRDGETNCFYSDGLGSTTEVTNAAGDTIATRAYSVFGETTETSGDLVFPYQYVGQKGYYRDAETGDYYVRVRPYRPTIARWLSVDPLGSRVDINLYRYAFNNPIMFNDPSGLAAVQASCPLSGGRGRDVGTFNFSRYWLLNDDDAQFNVEMKAVEYRYHQRDGRRYGEKIFPNAVGFAAGFQMERRAAECAECRPGSFNIVQTITQLIGGKWHSWTDSYLYTYFLLDEGGPRRHAAPLPFYTGTTFRKGERTSTSGEVTYPGDVTREFTSPKYEVSIFDRPNIGNPNPRRFSFDRDDILTVNRYFDTCLVCEDARRVGRVFKILTCFATEITAVYTGQDRPLRGWELGHVGARLIEQCQGPSTRFVTAVDLDYPGQFTDVSL